MTNSRVTFEEKTAFSFVLFQGRLIGWINVNGFRFYRCREVVIGWNDFTPEEKKAIHKEERRVLEDFSSVYSEV